VFGNRCVFASFHTVNSCSWLCSFFWSVLGLWQVSLSGIQCRLGPEYYFYVWITYGPCLINVSHATNCCVVEAHLLGSVSETKRWWSWFSSSGRIDVDGHVDSYRWVSTFQILWRGSRISPALLSDFGERFRIHLHKLLSSSALWTQLLQK
jgi:hypothetical protein